MGLGREPNVFGRLALRWPLRTAIGFGIVGAVVCVAISGRPITAIAAIPLIGFIWWGFSPGGPEYRKHAHKYPTQR